MPIPRKIDYLNRPAIEQGHTDDLIYEDEDTRVWRSRMTIEDGQPYDDQITIERLWTDKRNRTYWRTIRRFDPKKTKKAVCRTE